MRPNEKIAWLQVLLILWGGLPVHAACSDLEPRPARTGRLAGLHSDERCIHCRLLVDPVVACRIPEWKEEAMTNKPLPKGCKLARGVNKRVLTDEYDHWTVADFIEMLREYPQDARMWVQVGKDRLSPVEMIAGHEGEVIL